MPNATAFTLDGQYTRAQIRDLLGDPGKGGAWDTGYREFKGEYFIFCGLGVPGRTGHDYNNFWDGERLVWEAKGPTKLGQPEVRALLSGRHPVHVFTRENDDAPFRYEGLGRAVSATATTPVGVVWTLDADFRPPLERAEVEAALQSLGFSLDEAKVKSRRARLGDLTFYVKQESQSFVLVVPPTVEARLDELRAIPGVRRPMPASWYVHNQSFRDFPQRRHTATTDRPYGLDFDFDAPEALAEFVSTLRRPPARRTAAEPVGGAAQSPSNSDREDERDPRTETEAVRAARLGQSRFRSDLMRRWSRRCALTGLPLPELLRASHIKPWCDSTPKERLDAENGLLLAVHIDGLFDRGLVTFDDDGRLVPSPVLDGAVLVQLGLVGLRIEGLSDENRRYLAIHRAQYFQDVVVPTAAPSLVPETGQTLEPA